MIKAYLNNKPCVSPIELEDVGFSLSFNQTVQPDIENKTFTFIAEDKQEIDAWIANGRIFEGMPFKIQVSDENITLALFDGIIDFNDINFSDPQRYEVTIKLTDGLNHLESRTNGITMSLLCDRGVITSSNYSSIEYVVEKESSLLELALLSLSIYIFTKQIADVVKDVADNGANASALTVAGVSGAAASTLWIVLTLVIRAAYYAIMLIQLVKLVNELFSYMYSPVRTHKGININTAFQKIASYLGYGFQTGIDEMNSIVYLPSNQDANGSIEIGLPSVGDFGYRVSEFFELANQLWNTKVAVIDNVLHVRNIDDPFWNRLAEYKIIESEEFENYSFNNGDLIGSHTLRFATDINDVWTVNNIEGTIYGVKTYNKTIENEKRDLITGYEGISIECALGNRKEDLNTVETTLKELGGFVDELTSIFGGGTNYKKKVESRIGMLKVSSQYHSKPKLLFMSGNRLAMQQRSKLNAQKQYVTYHRSRSYVADNFKNQKKVYENKTIPFGLSDIAKLQKTNRALYKGKTVEVEKLTWLADQDTATISFKEPYIYTRNLIEIQST